MCIPLAKCSHTTLCVLLLYSIVKQTSRLLHSTHKQNKIITKYVLLILYSKGWGRETLAHVFVSLVQIGSDF